MTSALLTRAVALADRPTHDQADSGHPLLTVDWLDVTGALLEAGAPATADKALADILAQQAEQQYRDWIAYLQASHPGTLDPFDPTVQARLEMQAEALATGRLDLYEKRLRTFLQTEPTPDELATWLAERAIQDAATWARLDAAEARFEAGADFYKANPELANRRYTIEPLTAAEPRCLDIVGVEYDTYQDAESALSEARHPGCIHYIRALDA